MNEQISEVLSRVSVGVLEIVARKVLGDTSASPIGEPVFDEITTSHNDPRTIGIVKVSGQAQSEGKTNRWSVVAKIIDPSAFGERNADRRDITLYNELTVYELGLFLDDNIPLRPATCYLAQHVDDRFRILWLEDLSYAPQPP